MIVAGVDPGKSGGIILLDGDSRIVATQVMPILEKGLDVAGLLRFFKEHLEITHVFLEKSQSMPNQGVCGVFSYGVGFGVLQGMISALELPLTLVSPRTWTKVLHQGTAGSDDPKKRSLEAVNRLWPTFDFRASERCKKPHEGLVDAALIAEWGKRYLVGGTR